MRRRVANPIAAMVIDSTIVLPQIHLNNSFRFGKGPHPCEAHLAVYTAIQENSLQNRQQRLYTKGGLRHNVTPPVVEQELRKAGPFYETDKIVFRTAVLWNQVG